MNPGYVSFTYTYRVSLHSFAISNIRKFSLRKWVSNNFRAKVVYTCRIVSDRFQRVYSCLWGGGVQWDGGVKWVFIHFMKFGSIELNRSLELRWNCIMLQWRIILQDVVRTKFEKIENDKSIPTTKSHLKWIIRERKNYIWNESFSNNCTAFEANRSWTTKRLWKWVVLERLKHILKKSFATTEL